MISYFDLNIPYGELNWSKIDLQQTKGFQSQGANYLNNIIIGKKPTDKNKQTNMLNAKM